MAQQPLPKEKRKQWLPVETGKQGAQDWGGEGGCSSGSASSRCVARAKKSHCPALHAQNSGFHSCSSSRGAWGGAQSGGSVTAVGGSGCPPGQLLGLHPSIFVCLVLPLRGEALARLGGRQPPLYWPRCVEEALSKHQGSLPSQRPLGLSVVGRDPGASSATLAWHRAQHIVGLQ